MFGEQDERSAKNALALWGLPETMSVKIDLGYEISENGSNLSVGQKQLLRLGRAFLGDSQGVVIDEATSSVCSETGQKIQRTLKQKMEQCPVLTMAHRPHTVMRRTVSL